MFLEPVKKNSVEISGVPVGSGKFVVMAGPCSIESEKQFLSVARNVKSSGAHILRGGMYKLRTSPKSFQGLEEKAYPIVDKVRKAVDLPLVSEITDTARISEMRDHVDAFQIGTRNMYNYALLKKLSKEKKPVILKRSLAARIDEWIMASDYLEGNSVIFCERGIRTFETKLRNTFDINAIAYLNKKTAHPIIADPSHGTGDSELVTSVALASLMAGADGLLVEVHEEPKKAMSDGRQSLSLREFDNLMKLVEKALPIVGKTL